MEMYKKLDISKWPEWLQNGPVLCRVYTKDDLFVGSGQRFICALTENDEFLDTNCYCWGNAEPIKQWVPVEGEPVLCWDDSYQYAVIHTFKLYSDGTKWSRMNTFDNIAKCDENHYGKSLKVSDIIERGVERYEV